MKKTSAIAAAALSVALIATASVASADDNGKTITPDTKARLKAAQSAAAGIEPGTQGVERLAGADRYETAVMVSRSLWSEDNTGAVFLAVGTKFPDAVAASASTAQLGPVLLTEPDRLPDVTRAELQRLRPCLVFVVGDKNSVSENVAMEADAFTNPERCFG